MFIVFEAVHIISALPELIEIEIGALTNTCLLLPRHKTVIFSALSTNFRLTARAFRRVNILIDIYTRMFWSHLPVHYGTFPEHSCTTNLLSTSRTSVWLPNPQALVSPHQSTINNFKRLFVIET